MLLGALHHPASSGPGRRFGHLEHVLRAEPHETVDPQSLVAGGTRVGEVGQREYCEQVHVALDQAPGLAEVEHPAVHRALPWLQHRFGRCSVDGAAVEEVELDRLAAARVLEGATAAAARECILLRLHAADGQREQQLEHESHDGAATWCLAGRSHGVPRAMEYIKEFINHS